MDDNQPAEHKKHENELPYSVKDSLKGSAKLYNDMIEAKSFDRRAAAKQRAVDAWETVQSNRKVLSKDLERVKKGLEPQSALYKSLQQPKPDVVKPKTSILSSIYNWFLNINY